MSFPSDLEIARSVTPRPIVDVAHDLGLHEDEIEQYGPRKAKVPAKLTHRISLSMGSAGASGAALPTASARAAASRSST